MDFIEKQLRIARKLKISKYVVCPDNPRLMVDVPNWWNPLTYIYIIFGFCCLLVFYCKNKLWKK